MSRKVLILILAPILAILIAALAIPAFLDVNRYKPQIETRLERQLGRDVSLGEMRLTLIPLTFRVYDAVIGEAPEFQTGKPFARAQTLYVRPKLISLLQGNIQIRSLELTKPSVEVVRNADGIWNFATLANREDEEGRPVSIATLKITDGQIAVTDLSGKEPRTIYDHINLTLYEFAPDKRFSIEGRVHIPESGKQTIVFDGEAGPIHRGGIGQTPFDGRFELNRVSLTSLQRLLNIEVLNNSDAVLTGRADINIHQGVVASTGNLEALTPRIRGVQLGYPITVAYSIQGNLNDGTVQIQTADLRLGKTPMSAKGRVDTKRAPAVVNMNVTTSNASFADAARLAAAFGIAFNTEATADGVLDLDVHAHGPVNKLVFEGQAAARHLQISGGNLRQPVIVSRMELSMTPTTVQSNEFTASTGGTTVQARFTISGYTTDAPQLNARINTGNAQVDELLRIAHAYGVSAMDGITGSGTAHLNVAVSGPAKQTADLTYSGSGVLRNAIFQLPSLPKPISVRNADLRFNANSVFADNLDFALGETVARGNLTIHNPAAPRLEFALAADEINVREWQALTQAGDGQGPATAVEARNQRSQDSLLQRITGSGRVTVNTAVYDDLQLTNVNTTVKLDRGVITMDPVNAGLFGGQEVGTVVLDARTAPAAYRVDVRLQNVDANRLLSAVSPIKDALYGTVSATAHTNFTASGGAKNIVRSLDGRVSLNLNDGAIANMDLFHEMAAIAQFLRTATPVAPVTEVIQMTGDFDINDGVARTNNLIAAMDAGSFAATGTIDLGQQRLNLRLTAVLSKQYSEAAGGTRVGGFMTTAVANENGELVVPMIVRGTLQNPQFVPDLQKIAEMKLRQAVPSANNPAELGVGLLEYILRGGKHPQPEPPQQEEAQPAPEQQQAPEQEAPDLLNRFLKDIPKR